MGGCLELFIFENGQPMTTPPPKVYFWAFRLTVTLIWAGIISSSLILNDLPYLVSFSNQTRKGHIKTKCNNILFWMGLHHSHNITLWY